MTFRVDYFKGGAKVSSTLNHQTLDAAKSDVKLGLRRYRADEAQIRDLDLGGKTVERILRKP